LESIADVGVEVGAEDFECGGGEGVVDVRTEGSVENFLIVQLI